MFRATFFFLCLLATALFALPISILQYNIYGLPEPILYAGQYERFKQIPDAINKLQNATQIDAITFCEAFYTTPREMLLEKLAALGWKYHTQLLHDPNPFTSLENGGVIIASRYPIIFENQHIYRGACSGSDCLAAKGAVYARINKTQDGKSQVFHLFATHFQAWYDDKARAARHEQAKQLKQFADAQSIPRNEAVFFAGDFNVDLYHYRSDLNDLVATLNASEPLPTGNELYSSDPTINGLVGKDGAASANGCEKEYDHGGYCTCCPREYLDYVLYSKEHAIPVSQTSNVQHNQAIALKVPDFTVKWSFWGAHRTINDLSDHFPVLGDFVFE